MLQLLILIAACTAPADDSGSLSDDSGSPADAWTAPDQPGPYAVATRADAAPGPNGIELPVQLWYPAVDGGEPLHSYDDIFASDALDEAAPLCDSPRPVVLFSHGNGGVRYQSYFWTEWLAAHGFVVVAPDHVGNTLWDMDSVPYEDLVLRRPLDLSASFDWLVDDPVLGPCVDAAAGYAASGHSFGGYTALAAAGTVLDFQAAADFCADSGGLLCDVVVAMAAAGQPTVDATDPRVWAAIPMAPGGYELLRAGLPQVEVPVLVLGGDLDEGLTEEFPLLYGDLTVSPRFMGIIAGAGHFGFSDVCEMFGLIEDCSEPYLEPTEIHAVVQTTGTAFLQSTLGWSDAEAWLPPESQVLSWTAD